MATLAPNVMALLQYWDRLRQDNPLPLRDQLTPQSLQIWLGSLSINEFRMSPDGQRVFVGFQGELVSRGMRDSFSGKYLDQCVPGFAVEHAERPYMLAAKYRKVAYSRISPVTAQGSKQQFLRVVLPLAEHDPNTPAYFLVFTQTIGLDERAPGSIYALWADDDFHLNHECDIIHEYGATKLSA